MWFVIIRNTCKIGVIMWSSWFDHVEPSNAPQQSGELHDPLNWSYIGSIGCLHLVWDLLFQSTDHLDLLFKVGLIAFKSSCFIKKCALVLIWIFSITVQIILKITGILRLVSCWSASAAVLLISKSIYSLLFSKIVQYRQLNSYQCIKPQHLWVKAFCACLHKHLNVIDKIKTLQNCNCKTLIN